ncbi:MAG TPA: peptidoglycan editing factor PgeF [Steroidobacteraceae bacterium]|nr:peptidoglycan editing factor PgeF [Steroidobacteraceae bacterium]
MGRAPALLRPEWPAPPRVRSAFSLRSGGVSGPPWDSLNLGIHVGDDPGAVAQNRRRLREWLALPAEPTWLSQVHGARVAVLGADGSLAAAAAGLPVADAAVTRLEGVVCAIQVADCLPVLLAARDGSVIGAAHAGWRGLAAGVLEAALAALAVPANEVLAWVGPGIGVEHFEVGDEVRAAFLAGAATGRADPGAAELFHPNARGRWQCDLHGLARRRLERAGVATVYGERWCTYADASRFFSHRRDGRSGRMAALIWMA